MKKIAFVIFFLILLVGCNQSKNNGIKIGAILPLTGNVAFVGTPIRNVYEMVINEYNKKSVHKIRLIILDSKARPTDGINDLNKLISEGVKIVLGPVSSSVVLSVAPIANKNKVVIFSPSASSSLITNAGDYIFRNELSDKFGAEQQANIAISKLKWKKISILYINNDYGVGVANNFKKSLENRGGIVPSFESFQAGNTDFRTQLLKIKNDDSEAIFIIAQNEYVNIIKQIRELSINKKLYATPVFQDKNFIKEIGKKASEGIYYTYYGTYDEHSKNMNIVKFINNYRKNYNSDPTYYAALAYDNINILLLCLKNVNYDVQKVKNELYKIKDYNGITGQISFDSNGDVMKEVILKRIENGKFIIQ